MNSFESYIDVDHREQAKRKQQNCLLKSRTRLRFAVASWSDPSSLSSAVASKSDKADQRYQFFCRRHDYRLDGRHNHLLHDPHHNKVRYIYGNHVTSIRSDRSCLLRS